MLAAMRPVRLALAGASVLVVAACGKPAEPAAPVRAGGGAGPGPGSAAPGTDEATLRASIEAELRPRLRAEVEAELRPRIEAEVRARLEREHRVAATATSATYDGPDVRTPPPDTTPSSAEPDARSGADDAAEPAPPDGGGAATPGPGDPGDDVWTVPGVKIWPSPGGFRLVELAVGTGLEEKLPVNVKKLYEAVPELLYCYTVFENPGSETTVTHVWRRGSRLVSRVELEVGASPRWKTWSKQRTQAHWTGLWSCEVLAPDGHQLGLSVFQIGAQP